MVTKKQMSPDTSKGICVCAECKECKLGALTEFCLEQCARGTRVSVSPGDAEHGPGPNRGKRDEPTGLSPNAPRVVAC